MSDVNNTPEPVVEPKPAAPQAPAQDPQAQDAPGWLAGATAEQKQLDWAKKYGKLPEFIDAASQWKSKAENSITKPTNESTADEWAAYRTAMGIPTSPEDYKFPEEVEGMKMDPAMVADYRRIAHEEGIPLASAQKLLEWQAKQGKAYVESVVKATEKLVAETTATLQKEWGNDYARNHELAERGLAALPPELVEDAKSLGLVNKAHWARYFKELGSKNAEDQGRNGSVVSTDRPRGLIGNYNKQNHEY